MSFTETTYEGKTYTVPATGPRENLHSMLAMIPNDAYAMAFLMQDGNLDCPGCRYGTDTTSCAPIAMAVCRIMAGHSGDAPTYHGLDYDMGLVVNSSDDVAYMILEYGTDAERELIDWDTELD